MKNRALWLLSLATAAGFYPATLRAARIVERIIARVNNEVVTQRMFEREKQRLRASLAQDVSGPDLEAQVREQSKNLLRDLIDQALLVQKAKDVDINVDTEVVKRLDDIRKGANLATLEDLQREVEKQGLIWEDFKENIRRNLLMREVIWREVGRTIIVSREDSHKFYEEHKKEFESPGGVHLAEILVSTEKRKPEEAAQRVKEAQAELKAGARFPDVAKKYSDHSTANDGGDIGFFKTGTLNPAVAQVVEKLDVKDVSDVIETKNGPIILKVLEKVRPGVPAFEEVEQRVNEHLTNQKMQPAYRQYLITLRKESYIFLAPGYVDTGAERSSEAVLAKKGQ